MASEKNKEIPADELVQRIKDILEEKKAEKVAVLDVRELTSVTDYFVVCCGANKPHIKALAQYVQRTLKEHGIRCSRVSGDAESEWVVLDYFDVIVHVFSEQTHEYYSIDQLWKDAVQMREE